MQKEVLRLVEPDDIDHEKREIAMKYVKTELQKHENQDEDMNKETFRIFTGILTSNFMSRMQK